MTIKHNFFGKDCIIDRALLEREDARKALENKGLNHKSLLFVNQIHCDRIIVIDQEDKLYGVGNLPKADGIVTNLPNVALAVFTADCAPVILFDEENSIIAVAHAGWRGAALGILSNVIDEMKKLGATKIKAIIGPMIAQKSYEVSQEFLTEFLNEDKNNKRFFINSKKPEHYMFDLPSYVEKKLKDKNILNVQNLNVDTYENEKDFFSYRRSTHRNEKDCGRNISAIVIN